MPDAITAIAPPGSRLTMRPARSSTTSSPPSRSNAMPAGPSRPSRTIAGSPVAPIQVIVPRPSETAMAPEASTATPIGSCRSIAMTIGWRRVRTLGGLAREVQDETHNPENRQAGAHCDAVGGTARNTGAVRMS